MESREVRINWEYKMSLIMILHYANYKVLYDANEQYKCTRTLLYLNSYCEYIQFLNYSNVKMDFISKKIIEFLDELPNYLTP